MIIGIASTLQVFQTSKTSQTYSQTPEKEELASRCYWSIFILERIFAPQLKLAAIGKLQGIPAHPPSPTAPPPLSVDNNTNRARNSAIESSDDPGINAFWIPLVSLWGDLTVYLREIQSGNTESAWLPNSTNSQLNVQLHECQTQLATPHLFRNLSLLERSAEDLLEHREYWTSWALMQIVSHSVPAILNHPFVHLVATRSHGTTRIPKPTFFVQQTVDLALFHCGWVARLLRIFDSFPFELTNPIIGDMIAAVATVFWLFQFVRDTKVSMRAKEDLEKCESFLERMAPQWPHLAQKVSSSAC
jgi:hypothetical protein